MMLAIGASAGSRRSGFQPQPSDTLVSWQGAEGGLDPRGHWLRHGLEARRLAKTGPTRGFLSGAASAGVAATAGAATAVASAKRVRWQRRPPAGIHSRRECREGPSFDEAWEDGGMGLLRPFGLVCWPFLVVCIVLADSPRCLIQLAKSTAPKPGDGKGDWVFHVSSMLYWCMWPLRCTAGLCARIAKGLFYPIAAAHFLADSWEGVGLYIYFALPWWLRNKLAVTNDVDPVNFLPLLTRDDRLLRLAREHTCLRQSSVEAKREGRPYNASVRELSLYGAAIVTQYILFRGDVDRRANDHDYVSAAVHIMDDYADRHEDLEAGNLNYFNDAPNPVPIEEWIGGNPRSPCRGAIWQVHQR